MSLSPLEYASSPSSRRLGWTPWIGIQILSLTGLGLCGSSAYEIYLELSTRRAIPSTEAPLYFALVGAAFFGTAAAIGISRTSFRHRTWFVIYCLLLGLVCLSFAETIGVAWE